ncbi:MAG: lipoate--protein ligase [Balneolales bacterium]
MITFVYIDNEDITDPTLNLAIEEYALRQMNPTVNYFLLYRNKPTIVVGRNQNTWEEMDDFYVRKKGIHVVRRLSGGGAVYHDLGNLNFSFITKYEQSRLHNFKFFNEPVLSALRLMGVPATMNDRNDILVGGKKISGNAQFSSRGRMISHGTLLFDSSMDQVSRVLSSKMNQINSKSHKSTRSEVANISDFLREPIRIQTFRKQLLDGLKQIGKVTNRIQLKDADWEEIYKIQNQRYRQWEWNIGRSPGFQIVRSRNFSQIFLTMRIEVDKGVIKNLNMDEVSGLYSEDNVDFSGLAQLLTGVRYDPYDIHVALNNGQTLRLPPEVTITDLEKLIYGEDGV